MMNGLHSGEYIGKKSEFVRGNILTDNGDIQEVV
jgi:hypothetical protein